MTSATEVLLLEANAANHYTAPSQTGVSRYMKLHVNNIGVYILCRVLGLSSEFKDGILFSTYATLVSSVSKGSSLLAALLLQSVITVYF